MIVAVDLKLEPDTNYHRSLYKFSKMYEWLTQQEIDFKLYYIHPQDDALPHTIILSGVDATALKLKFNL